MGVLSGFDVRPENVYGRYADVVIANTGTTSYYHFGSIQDVSIEAEPVSMGPDSHQREQQVAFDITIQFSLRQTGYSNEFTNIDALTTPPNGVDGFRVKICDCGIDPDTGFPGNGALTEWENPAVTAAGSTFDNCYPMVGTQLNFGGETSMIPVTIKGRVSPSEWAKLGTSVVSLKSSSC